MSKSFSGDFNSSIFKLILS